MPRTPELVQVRLQASDARGPVVRCIAFQVSTFQIALRHDPALGLAREGSAVRLKWTPGGWPFDGDSDTASPLASASRARKLRLLQVAACAGRRRRRRGMTRSRAACKWPAATSPTGHRFMPPAGGSGRWPARLSGGWLEPVPGRRYRSGPLAGCTDRSARTALHPWACERQPAGGGLPCPAGRGQRAGRAESRRTASRPASAEPDRRPVTSDPRAGHAAKRPERCYLGSDRLLPDHGITSLKTPDLNKFRGPSWARAGIPRQVEEVSIDGCRRDPPHGRLPG